MSARSRTIRAARAASLLRPGVVVVTRDGHGGLVRALDGGVSVVPADRAALWLDQLARDGSTVTIACNPLGLGERASSLRELAAEVMS